MLGVLATWLGNRALWDGVVRAIPERKEIE